jgi:hypothetical protein
MNPNSKKTMTLTELRDWLRKPGILKNVITWHISNSAMIRLMRWIDDDFVDVNSPIGLEKLLPELEKALKGFLSNSKAEAELLKTPPAKAKPGRKRRYDPIADQAFAEAWDNAKSAGVCFKQFCKEKKPKVDFKKGKRILNRVQKRH